MDRFIDDVSVLVIEDCLIGKVSGLFGSSKVLEMNPDDISRLAGETTESSVERKRLVDKRKILDAGLRGLKGLQKQKQFARSAEWDPVSSEDVEERSDKTTLDSERASNASFVITPSPVMHFQDEVDPPLEEDFQLPAAPEISKVPRFARLSAYKSGFT